MLGKLGAIQPHSSHRLLRRWCAVCCAVGLLCCVCCVLCVPASACSWLLCVLCVLSWGVPGCCVCSWLLHGLLASVWVISFFEKKIKKTDKKEKGSPGTEARLPFYDLQKYRQPTI